MPEDERTTSAISVRDLRAMNTDIHLVACGPRAGRRLARADAWLQAFEARFSRFLPTSEVSRLNASAGARFRVSPALLHLVELALDYAGRTDGLFDPAILRDLERAGYDRSFELVPLVEHTARPRVSELSWRDVRIDTSARTIELPAGGGIDLGGIGKGYAVDGVARILRTPCLVNCGGDVFAGGRPPGEEAWLVGVSDPFDQDADLMVLRLEDRAVATSSTMNRRWSTADGAVKHHLIDPRTGAPSESDAVQVTVVAPAAVEADVMAKVALLLGAEEGIRYLNAQSGVEGLAVRGDRASFQSANFGRYWEP